jgi:hypothetical protein
LEMRAVTVKVLQNALTSGSTTGLGSLMMQEGSKDEPGVAPRSLQRLFEEASYDTSINYSYSLSMLEVYKGSLRDLLVARPTRNSDHVTKG